MKKQLSKLAQTTQKFLTTWGAAEAELFILSRQIQHQNNVWDRRNWTGHLSASALLLDRTRTYCYFVKHKVMKVWLAPGGHCEPFELPWEGAARELKEETSIADAILHPWHIKNEYCPVDINTHKIPARKERGEEEHMHHDFQYVFLSPTVGVHRQGRGEDGSMGRMRSIERLKEKYAPALQRIKAMEG